MLRDGEVAVRLTEAEMFVACVIGVRREIAARVNGWKNRFEPTSEQFAWGKHVVGALAEAACAKSLGVWWHFSLESFRRLGDVGALEVRWSDGSFNPKTRQTYPPRLKVRDDEKPETILVLVSGKAPDYVVRGWIRAATAKRPEWRGTPVEGPPAFFVPMESLAPMYTLPTGTREE